MVILKKKTIRNLQKKKKKGKELAEIRHPSLKMT